MFWDLVCPTIPTIAFVISTRPCNLTKMYLFNIFSNKLIIFNWWKLLGRSDNNLDRKKFLMHCLLKFVNYCRHWKWILVVIDSFQYSNSEILTCTLFQWLEFPRFDGTSGSYRLATKMPFHLGIRVRWWNWTNWRECWRFFGEYYDYATIPLNTFIQREKHVDLIVKTIFHSIILDSCSSLGRLKLNGTDK